MLAPQHTAFINFFTVPSSIAQEVKHKYLRVSSLTKKERWFDNTHSAMKSLLMAFVGRFVGGFAGGVAAKCR